mmetsp:Transcript_70355/g.165637  ORF Transcript_70355/g.165637 Transcript_70355/m.165637 type:complete len:351 (-) Transcript_70355:47-1099(-)
MQLEERGFDALSSLGSRVAEFCWRIESLDEDCEEDCEEAVRRLLQDPMLGSVRSLCLASWGEMSEESPENHLTQLIMSAPKLTSLAHVTIGDCDSDVSEISWITQCDVSVLVEALPNLLSINTQGGNDLAWRPIVHTRLRQIVMRSGGLPKEPVLGIQASYLPNLTKLELWLGQDDYGGTIHPEDLRPLLRPPPGFTASGSPRGHQGAADTAAGFPEETDGTGRVPGAALAPQPGVPAVGCIFPNLRYLGLRNAEIIDRLCVMIVDSEVVTLVETLDLADGTMTNTGARELVRLGASPPGNLTTLNLDHNWIDATWRERIATALPGVAIDFGADAGDMDEVTFRYTAVGE